MGELNATWNNSGMDELAWSAYPDHTRNVLRNDLEQSKKKSWLPNVVPQTPIIKKLFIGDSGGITEILAGDQPRCSQQRMRSLPPLRLRRGFL